MATYTVYLAAPHLNRWSPEPEAWAVRKEYDYIASVRVEAASVDDVFEMTNLWSADSQVTRLVPQVRSTSVGDVIVESDGTAHMVDRFGFKPVKAVV